MNLSLIAKNLEFAREEQRIFSRLNFSLKSGELLRLKGSNGSGKTTLLRILATLISSFTGSILFNDEAIDNNLCYKDTIVYAGHKLACFPNQTVLANLTFWANIKGTKALILPALYFLQLHIIQDFAFCKLSAGWQKRVSLARLLLFNAKIWLLDEPFINLDKEAQSLLLNLIETRLSHGGIVIIAAHEDFIMGSGKAASSLELNLNSAF